MKSRANYIEYILDTILMLVVIQLFRIVAKFILISQLNLSLENLIVTTIISFMVVGTILLLIFKNNPKFTHHSLKLVNMFNHRNKYIKVVLGIIVGIASIITPYFNGGYSMYNIELLILSIIIIPIFEELLFREHIWNYLTYHIKNTTIIFIATMIMYSVYQIGYIDIISQYMKLTSMSGYMVDILIFNIVKGLILGSILNFIRIKFKDIYICIMIHILFSILLY
ncbi:CPBP family intramembrane metalloprotease [Romboutsia sp. CE17]|uniref:CPBP family glutamic-type intramembrane protease n=1 Tax=Romboutsia sp. CE17 TaxID=2724150 RepID=UPI001442C05A|nr:CPBP family glutamic-type intramembrane protease [Romboutsia sp. CE17]QJA07799.1 CPBP family intramembrane metalloprotease [Romboutsia sp. CE17]